MPLTLPNLDDRRYLDLVEEARALIPTHAPEWTNHNASDPGIMLIELFAWLSEMLIYRLNRVTDENARKFLWLLNGEDWQPSGDSREALADDIRQTVLALRRRERAVSADDFEALAREADERVARVRCLPRRNALMDFEADQPGHVSLVVVASEAAQTPAVLAAVAAYLEPRRLLTTFIHVVEAPFVPVDVAATIVPLPDVTPGELQPKVDAALRAFLDPRRGGEQKSGWPFGRNVYVSEIYQLLDELPGVDYVSSVGLATADPARQLSNAQGNPLGLAVKPHELVGARTLALTVTPV
ncbi:baseplate J/gp47 family protein [Accumulibacter sp.]|uniref:baseplate J/gp47 family protein n=1 Tax=Accumulibacter sp. TaxID=2053492 RepID=UPI0025F5CFFD|nr:baseplate J/gp47 family protein [Accumulibacter sp.]MCM8596521.1 baseplate J/gp47 family protein [Accumulibacter sp.]MCM8627307.1 baseplate J/gp47 family protein [Accumulibacter sp.]MDS4050670.1 baseplate J/gp47 family protein [Accumulibacter sp.]